MRAKFLARNRPYLLSRLDDLLTPDAFQKHGVYLQQQYRMLQEAVRPRLGTTAADISDDSSEAEEADATKHLHARPLRDMVWMSDLKEKNLIACCAGLKFVDILVASG